MRLFQKGKSRIIAKFHWIVLVICSHSRERKTPSYSRRNTVNFLSCPFPGIFYYSQDMFLYYPDQPANSRIFVELPTKLHLPFENTSIKTSDGVSINVVLIKHASRGAPTVILLHGNAGNIGHRYNTELNDLRII